MAETSIPVCEDQFMCPVCLDLLKDPVAIPCGHSYCMDCIKGCWDQDDQKGVYSCPQCREIFRPRPALRKNTMLAELVAKLNRTGGQATPVVRSVEPEDVVCDSCIGKKEKALKTCLTCLASYCETHVQPHFESLAFQKHTLVKATTPLKDQICSTHNKAIELWCQTDQKFLCYICMVDEHNGHKIVSVAAERAERQRHVGETRRKSQQRIKEREKKLQELRQAVASVRRSAQAAVEDSERIFTELIRSIEKRRREMTELIRDQEKSELSRAEGVLERLEQEIVDLRRRDTELEQLSHTEDHIHFLKTFSSVCASPGSEDFPCITVSPHLSFEDVGRSISQLKERLESFCKEEFGRLSTKGWGISEITSIKVIPPPESKTREDFLQYSCDLTLDPNTVNKYLCLSEGNRMVTHSKKARSYDHHPDRFDYYVAVLCRESVSTRSYWEVEWSRNWKDEEDGLYVAVSYKGLGRKGGSNECRFGYNDQSWTLVRSVSSYSFIHNSKVTKLPTLPSSSRIGVYVDHRAGILSFYEVSDTMTLLHRVHTTFTQHLYPGFSVWGGSNVRLCHHPK
ncbi:tripartite motif-containing protein 16-like isoform X2 [Chanos chanos]|uniref:Tripartite motif-containing protein 16-like isoform X2 n=1 Tax=Chanos chanos TaxID=29144 RepID=A0A6J2VL00_CHACN|nr:tripartite motif-containing protein 16-like isoform X2 [Chanos chanos]